MKLEIGGAETHIVELSRELKRRGHEVVVASNGGVFVEELNRNGIRHVKLPLHTKRLSSVIRSYLGLKKLIAEEKFDIVHAHARIPAFICGYICSKYKIRFITSAHWVFKVNFIWRRIADWGERSVAVSYDIKQYLIENYGVCSDNISVTINGIDTEKFSTETDASAFIKEYNLEPSARRVVCVSRIDRDRSLAPILLCKAAPELKKRFPELEIVIVGAGDDYERLRIAAAEANASSDKPFITLCGARTDINSAIASGEIFVGVSRAALEAMAAEKPCVIAGNEGYIGIFDQNKLGIAFDTNFCCRGCEQTTSELLLRDVSALLEAKNETLAELGAYNRSVIMRRYSVNRMADDYMTAYEKLKPFHPDRNDGIILSGYYGYRNSGDDALLGVIVNSIRNELPDVGITALSKTPEQTSLQYGIDSVGRFNWHKIKKLMKHSKLFINGGGTLLTNSMTSTRSLWYYTSLMRTAKKQGLGVMLYANGVGPVEGDYGAKLAREALEECDLISLREELSRCEISKLGIKNPNVKVTADPAFMLTPCDGDWLKYLLVREGFKPGSKYVCLALRLCEGLDRNFESEVLAACDEMRKRYGLIPVFAAMQRPADMELCRKLAKSANGLFPSELTASELIGLMSACEFTVGMRLHSLIYSAVAGTPVIPISYDVKVDALVESLNNVSQPKYNIKPLRATAFKSSELLLQADNIMSDRASASGYITKAAKTLGEKARASASLVKKLMKEL